MTIQQRAREAMAAEARRAPGLRVYIAASFARRDELRGVAAALEAYGFRSTARWIHAPEADPAVAAAHDLADIDAADGVLSITDGPAAGYQTGGRHFEAGYAFARGKWLWIVGPREHVFHVGISRIRQFDTLRAWIEYMTGPQKPR